MTFKAGQPKVAGSGRKPGVPNKSSADIRAAFAALVEANASKVQEAMDRVYKGNPARYVELIARFAEFCVPKLQRTEMTGLDGAPIETQAVIGDAALEAIQQLSARLRAVGTVTNAPAQTPPEPVSTTH